MSGSRLHGLDHLRALAIAMIFLWHYKHLGLPEWLKDSNALGWTGPDLFFALSGFLVTRPLLRRVELGDYYLGRALRILPPYLAVLAAYRALPWTREHPVLPPLWKMLSFTQNYGFDQTARAFSHSWSLCVENWFYLLLPLGVSAARRGRLPAETALLALVAVGIALREHAWTTRLAPLRDEGELFKAYFQWIHFPTHLRLDSLLAGVGAAAFVELRPEAWARLSRHWPVLLAGAAAALWGVLLLGRERYSPAACALVYPLLAAGYGLLLLAAIAPESPLHRVPWGVSRLVAELSYGIYLTHKQARVIAHALLESYGWDARGTAALLASIALSLLFAAALRAAVELPCQALRERLRRRDAAPAPAPEAAAA